MENMYILKRESAFRAAVKDSPALAPKHCIILYNIHGCFVPSIDVCIFLEQKSRSLIKPQRIWSLKYNFSHWCIRKMISEHQRTVFFLSTELCRGQCIRFSFSGHASHVSIYGFLTFPGNPKLWIKSQHFFRCRYLYLVKSVLLCSNGVESVRIK